MMMKIALKYVMNDLFSIKKHRMYIKCIIKTEDKGSALVMMTDKGGIKNIIPWM